jgi:hypothetical protein
MVAGLFALVSVGLGARLATIAPAVQIVYDVRPEFSREPPVSALAGGLRLNDNSAIQPLRSAPGYLGLRDQVVRFGADSLPTVSAGAGGSPDSVEKLLGLPSGTLDDAQKSRLEHQLYRGGV